MRNPLSFRSFPRIAIGLLLIIFPTSLVPQVAETIFAYPVGSVAMFPHSAGHRLTNAEKIHLRALARGAPVWDVDPVTIPLPEQQSPNNFIKGSAIGFIVPQLPRGAYIAWYETREPDPSRSMKLEIAPILLVDDAIVRTTPGADAEVRVHIFPSVVSQRDIKSPQTIVASITLETQNPEVADLSIGQRATVRTGRDAYAAWKVHVKNPGVAEFIAKADGFDSAAIDVVGMPAVAPTFREAELIAARSMAEAARAAANAAAFELRELEAAAQGGQSDALRNEAQAKAEENRKTTPPKEAPKTAGKEAEASAKNTRERTRIPVSAQRLDEARVRARVTTLEADKAAAEVNRLAAQLPTLQPRSITEDDLKPGDVLLVSGNFWISPAIRLFEKMELGVETPYSHAAIYLGKVNGTGMVAEMLKEGFLVSSLGKSTTGDLLIDAYRWEDIDDARRQQIADQAAHPYGPVIQSGAPLPYAFEQLGVLGSTAVSAPLGPLDVTGPARQRAVVSLALPLADLYAGGRRKMICSEMVAWVYYDVGLGIGVKHWKAFRDNDFLTTEDRRKDYTTPNMLARSANLHQVGRLLGP